MATQPEIAPPDRIDPQSPPEAPPIEPPAEAPPPDGPPGFDLPVPDHDEPRPILPETPPPD